MARDEALAALEDVLIDKFYPRDPSLIRNDIKTANLVKAFLDEIQKTYNASRNKATDKRTYFQNEAFHIYFELYALHPLSEQTLRKYISELWSDQKFCARIKICAVKVNPP